MAVNILIKPKEKVNLTFSKLKEIAGNEFVYGHSNSPNYVFFDYEGEDITNVDIILYDPVKIGRGITVCALEDGNIETLLNVPCTSNDVKNFFNVVKRLCNYCGVEEFIMDEESVVPVADIEELKGSIREWNTEVLGQYLEQNKEGTLIIFGGSNPVGMGTDMIGKLLTLLGGDMEKVFADYINEKQQIDAHDMNPRIYRHRVDGILGAYALTEGVVSIIPKSAYIPFNSGLPEEITSDNIDLWAVSLVVQNGDEYEVAGYVNYADLIDNLPEESFTQYDNSHYLVKGLSRAEIDSLVSKLAIEI